MKFMLLLRLPMAESGRTKSKKKIKYNRKKLVASYMNATFFILINSKGVTQYKLWHKSLKIDVVV